MNAPRLSLGHFPTPLYRLDAASARYGRSIWIKRDDLCGVALGGNKVRKLEYLLARARRGGCDTVLTTGGAQSNHAALTAACAARLGMDCHLLLKARGVTDLRGNLILDRLFGAHVHFVDTDSYDDIYAEMDRLAASLAAAGHRAYPVPLGGSTPLGALGYVEAVRELTIQASALGCRPKCLVSATGSGGTTAGLLVGVRAYLPDACAVGVAVDEQPFESIVTELASGAAALLGEPAPVRPGDFRMLRHIGAGYAVPDSADTRLIQELARLEGILLDPVYTGKAWAGMLESLHDLPPEGDIVFFHTGGAAALFAVDLPGLDGTNP